MRQEMKITLPFYKIAYAVCFVIILSLIRGVSFSYEVGIALEAPLAILVSVFCADTYTQEITSKRSEINRLYPMKKRVSSIMQRMLVQEGFLFFLAIVGYGLFYLFQHPMGLSQENIFSQELKQFAVYAAAIIVTLIFWGSLSNMLSILLRNMWGGAGSCLILWLMTNSSSGDKLLGSWNLFSYTFRSIENDNDYAWMFGKILCILLSAVMAILLPQLLKKRG